MGDSEGKLLPVDFNSNFMIEWKTLLHKNDEFVTIRDKCPKIPPSTSLHFATRLRRSLVVLLNWSSRFMRAAASKARRSNSSPVYTFFFKLRSSSNPTNKNLAELAMEIQTALLGYISESGICSYKLFFWGGGRGAQLPSLLLPEIPNFTPESPCTFSLSRSFALMSYAAFMYFIYLQLSGFKNKLAFFT